MSRLSSFFDGRARMAMFVLTVLSAITAVASVVAAWLQIMDRGWLGAVLSSAALMLMIHIGQTLPKKRR